MRELALALLCLTSCSCGSRVARPVAAVVDCARLEAPRIGAELGKLASLAPDWARVYQTAVHDAREIGAHVVACALAEVARDEREKKSAVPAPAAWSAASVLARYRAAELAGATIRTAHGDM
jgi:hypothetical protein